MLGRLFAGFAFAASILVALQTHAAAQQRGQQPATLTEKQFQESQRVRSELEAERKLRDQELQQRQQYEATQRLVARSE